jgi:lysozyme family protein
MSETRRASRWVVTLLQGILWAAKGAVVCGTLTLAFQGLGAPVSVAIVSAVVVMALVTPLVVIYATRRRGNRK